MFFATFFYTYILHIKELRMRISEFRSQQLDHYEAKIKIHKSRPNFGQKSLKKSDKSKFFKTFTNYINL